MIIGRQLIERMYSDNEVQEEKLYSTGNDELDDLLERAFCEGYEYAQREFGNESFFKSKNNFIGRLGRSFEAASKKRQHAAAQQAYQKDKDATYNKLQGMWKNIENNVRSKIGNIGSTEARNEINKNSIAVAKVMNQRALNRYLDRVKKI